MSESDQVDAPHATAADDGSTRRAPTQSDPVNPYGLPLSAPELGELTRALGAFTIHRVLGMFCAVASVPRSIPDSVWLTEVLEDVPFTDEGAFRDVADKLIPLCLHVREHLAESEIEALVPEAADAAACGAWARGYASLLRHIDPAELPDEIIEASFAIQVLGGEPAMLKLLDELRGERSRDEALAEHRERLADDAGFLFEAWADEPKRPLVSTIRRSEPKVGRNDACPCGSGKKYKKCCEKA